VDDKVRAKAIEYGPGFKKAADLAITSVQAGDYHSVSDVSMVLVSRLDIVQPFLIGYLRREIPLRDASGHHLGRPCRGAHHPALGYTVTYAVGTTLLIIWGVVIVLLLG
jgi:hypothetical protein